MTENRRFFRVSYPSFLRPQLEMARGRALYVLDLSERGVRVALDHAAAPLPETEVSGSLHFRRGARVAIRAHVLRVTAHDVALLLDPGIPLQVILTEQRFVLKGAEARGPR